MPLQGHSRNRTDVFITTAASRMVKSLDVVAKFIRIEEAVSVVALQAD